MKRKLFDCVKDCANEMINTMMLTIMIKFFEVHSSLFKIFNS